MDEKYFENRKSIRNPDHDYSSSCMYFVTTCVDQQREYLGLIQENTIRLNTYGKMIEQQWLWLAEQYPYVSLDEYVVMPNHFHGIITINTTNCEFDADVSGWKAREPPLQIRSESFVKIKSLTELIGAFKTTSSKLVHRFGLTDFKWQRSFHDRIIHNLVELDLTRTYIKNNPSNWHCHTS